MRLLHTGLREKENCRLNSLGSSIIQREHHYLVEEQPKLQERT